MLGGFDSDRIPRAPLAVVQLQQKGTMHNNIITREEKKGGRYRSDLIAAGSLLWSARSISAMRIY